MNQPQNLNYSNKFPPSKGGGLTKKNMKRVCISMPDELAKQLTVLRAVDKVGTDACILSAITKVVEKLCFEKNIKVSLVGTCKKCGSELVERKTQNAKFYGCSKYPKCKYTENVKK